MPAHADIEDIEVIFVDEPDPKVPLRVKGLGENGIVAFAAAFFVFAASPARTT